MPNDPSCEEGHRECVSINQRYANCVRYICRNDGTEVCSRAERECSSTATRYWNCVTKTCLGDAERYREEIKTKRALEMQQRKRQQTTPQAEQPRPTPTGQRFNRKYY